MDATLSLGVTMIPEVPSNPQLTLAERSINLNLQIVRIASKVYMKAHKKLNKNAR